MKVSINEYDGFYFNPNPKNDGEVEFSFFRYNEEADRGEKLEASELGDMYHIILWESDDTGLPKIVDDYEAILIDPTFYAQCLTEGARPSYGIIIRKTTQSFKFVQSYYEKFERSVEVAMQTLKKLSDKKRKGWFKK